MAKKKSFERTIDLSLEQIYEVVTSREYLLRLGEPREGQSDTEVIDSSFERTTDGGVVADVEIEFSTPVRPGSEPVDRETANGDVPEVKKVRISQETRVSGWLDNGFTVQSDMPLPGGMGSMDMHFSYYSHDSDADKARVDILVTVDVSVPMVGGMIAKRMLGESEQTVDRGFQRIVSLAGRPEK